MASPGAVAAVLAGCGAGGVAAALAGRLAWACIAFRPATSRTWYDRKATNCDSVTTAGVDTPAAGRVLSAASSPSTGFSISLRVNSRMAVRRVSAASAGLPVSATWISAALVPASMARWR